MKYRIIKHVNNEDVWFTAKIRKFFIWFDVKVYDETSYFPGDDIILSEVVKFKSVDEIDKFVKKHFSRESKCISFEGNV